MTEETMRHAAAWMGRLHLCLRDQHSEATAYLELSVREEFITVWERNATLAVLHRDQFRRWFWNPVGSFSYDDLVWTVEGTRLCLSICGSVPWFVPEDFVDQLVSVL
jgi:hypothetical protein